MIRKYLLNDLIRVWLLFTLCIGTGLVANELRSKPLPLVYSAPQARLDQQVSDLSTTPSAIALDGEVDRLEMQKISASRLAIILDARPEVFYRLGHIPGAISLPRDDFETQYKQLQPSLAARHDQPLIVYCSSSECHDSQMVADALLKLGYAHVRIFRAGWSAWEEAGLLEEKNEN